MLDGSGERFSVQFKKSAFIPPALPGSRAAYSPRVGSGRRLGMTPPAVVLDVDGTLVDSNYQHALTWHRAFAQHGRAVPAWRAHRAIGVGGERLVRRALRRRLNGRARRRSQGDGGGVFGEMIDSVAPLPRPRVPRLLHARGRPVVLGSSAKAHDLDATSTSPRPRPRAAWTTSCRRRAHQPAPDSSRSRSEARTSRSARDDRRLGLRSWPRAPPGCRSSACSPADQPRSSTTSAPSRSSRTSRR